MGRQNQQRMFWGLFERFQQRIARRRIHQMNLVDNGDTHPALERPQHENITKIAYLRYLDGSVFRFDLGDIRMRSRRYFGAETTYAARIVGRCHGRFV